MQDAEANTNADHSPRLLDLLPDLGAEGFGSAIVRLAEMAAALHRAECADGGAEAWSGLTRLEFDREEVESKDKAEQGCSAVARSARDHGPVTTEGDR